MNKDNHLRYKLGQMLLLGFDGATVNNQSDIIQAIQGDGLGGVILFDLDFKTRELGKNIVNPAQVKTLNQALQSANTQAHQDKNRATLPLLISLDYEGGKINRLKPEAGFPETVSPAVMGQMPDEELRHTAQAMAKTLKDLGFNLDFAPTVDVNLNPDNPIIGKLQRSFSEDPLRVTQAAQLFIDAFAQYQIQCSLKHYPGHGSSAHDSHLEFVDVTSTWRAEELLPYQQILSKDQWCQMVMTAHIVNRNLDPSGLPATLSSKILNDLLRKTLGFKGVVITDDMQMRAIADHYSLEKAIPMAIAAGADMFIIGNQLGNQVEEPQALIDMMESQVHSGLIAEAAVDKAFERIQAFKQRLI